MLVNANTRLAYEWFHCSMSITLVILSKLLNQQVFYIKEGPSLPSKVKVFVENTI